MKPYVLLFLLPTLFLFSCGNSSQRKPETAMIDTTASAFVWHDTLLPHEAEVPALNFIRDVKAGKYDLEIYEFEADKDLDPRDKRSYFNGLSDFIKTEENWHRWYTFVEQMQGSYFASVYLMSENGHILMLHCEQDKEGWVLLAYEYPEFTFKKPSPQMSYEDYVVYSLKEELSHCSQTEEAYQKAEKKSDGFYRLYEVPEVYRVKL